MSKVHRKVGVSERNIERLALYRRAILRKPPEWETSVYSHQLGAVCEVSAAQVRRDLMAIGYSGTPTAGYDIARLYESIGAFLDSSEPTPVAIVGVGHLGRAIIDFFANRRPKLVLTAAFDRDPAKANRVLHGVRCYPVDRLAEVIAEQRIEIAVLAVPATQAQAVGDALVGAGIRGILNFAPAFLRLPPHVVLERVDMTVALEKVAFLARATSRPRKKLP